MKSCGRCCRGLAMQFEVPVRISQAAPDSARVAQIRKAFAESATPVPPLPSNTVIMLACVGVFTVLAVLFTTPLGFTGFLKLSAAARVVDYTIILLLAMVLAGGVVEQMIPGSRRVMQPGVSVLVAILLLSMIAAVQFPVFAMDNFVQHGIPCLRAGLLCAIPAGVLTWALMRRGFATDATSAGIAGGAFAGLLGVAVLALHCPIFNAAHIIVWHLGTVVVASLGGGLLSRAATRYR
jgi:hypothetical protein